MLHEHRDDLFLDFQQNGRGNIHMNPFNLNPCLLPTWAPTAHAQTVLGHLLASPMLASKGRKMEFPLPDGDQLVGFVQEGTSTTVVYIFHGLAGSTDSPYMHRTSRLAQKLGHTVIMMNHRGCGEGAGLAKLPYHSGRAEDLSSAIEAGRKLFPRHRHLAIGFSMSANALLLLLSGQRGSTLPDAAIAVNAPIDLKRCGILLKTGFNRVYDIKFYLQCKRDTQLAKNELLNSTRLPKLTTVYEFDRLYTAPAGGFSDRDDYYRTCSTHLRLQQIKIPTVILTAEDDPFVPFDSYLSAEKSPSVICHFEKHGGHMGYLTREKTELGSNRWQDYAIHRVIQKI
jgi:predicted alpha/beta-fold hydrolase